MIGIPAVSGLLFSAVISSLPDIFGICISVTIRSGMHARQNFQGFRAIGGRLDRKATLLQEAAHGVADQHGVVDD